jgi:phospholipase/carboxylesterase
MDDVPILSGPSAAPAAGGAPRSLVIFLHGYGSNGEDLIGLAPYWQETLPHTLFLAPNAPELCPGAPGGYQWWALSDLSPSARAAGVRKPVAVLNAYIEAQLTAHGLAEDRLALVGFSQGTMMALHVGPRRENTLAGIVGYSGMLADPEALISEVRSKPPVLLVHGDADPVLPVAALQAASVALRQQGFEVAAYASPGLAHSIDAAGLRLGEDFLKRVFG